MRGRLTWLLFGVVFSVTLALIVGQRLSAESMAVVIGVIAGVAASIPTSLLVVWFMGRAPAAPTIIEAAPSAARSAEPIEPRIVVMPAPAPQPQPTMAPQPAYAGLAGYGQQSYAGFAPAMPARRFTVIGGGGESVVEEPVYVEESVTWQR